jgi:glutamyl/glutaminyl-tRNA synthetase
MQRLIAMGRVYEAFETPTELDLRRKKQLSMGKPPVYDRAALRLSEEEKARLRAERPSHWRFLSIRGGSSGRTASSGLSASTRRACRTR